ncbi:MAG: hypothetical protein EHM45_10680 [Desulfobacteraceae bacterium]|nr:MAG: hypothetical protein EHM45_10680 [Desulfobacteraceae bacterium]
MQTQSVFIRNSCDSMVLLGASNLTLGFPWVVKLAQELNGDSIEIWAALGYDRSYGRQSRVLGRVLPGILYGFDPIHIRLGQWKNAWQNILESGHAPVSWNSIPKIKVSNGWDFS